VSAASWRIEDILMAARLATAEDLERARRRMRERGGRLLANLFACVNVPDEEFARRLGQELSLPVADAARLQRVAAPRTPSRRAALRALAIERVLLPIGATREPRAVEVAMFDPSDGEAIERLRHICGGAEVKIAVAARHALLDAIGKTYGREASGVLGGEPSVVIHDEAGAAPAPVLPSVGVDDSEEITIGGARTAPASPVLPAAFVSADDPTPPPRIPPRDVRLSRVLLEAVGLLADLLEERVARRPRSGKELARYTRLVARELGYAPASVDELGVTASLYAVERSLDDEAEAAGSVPVQLDEALGWAAGAPEGIGPTLRALRQPGASDDPPFGAYIIAAVREFLHLAAATPDGHPDMNTVNQLLRVTTPPEIIDALGRVVSAERQKEQGDAV
jgi:hypothetical protein